MAIVERLFGADVVASVEWKVAKPLFSILDGLHANIGRCNWISVRRRCNNCDMGEDTGYIGIEIFTCSSGGSQCPGQFLRSTYNNKYMLISRDR